MAANKNFLGVALFGLGAPGDGVMGSTLTNFPDVEVGSVNIEGSQANQETISTESADSYITVNNDATPNTVTARLFGVTPAQMVLLAGGVVDGSDGLWNAPSTVPEIFLSFRMEGKQNGGEKGVLEMAYAKVTARVQGTITKNGLPAVDVTITANTPVANNGDTGSPFRIGTVTV